MQPPAGIDALGFIDRDKNVVGLIARNHQAQFFGCESLHSSMVPTFSPSILEARAILEGLSLTAHHS